MVYKRGIFRSVLVQVYFNLALYLWEAFKKTQLFLVWGSNFGSIIAYLNELSNPKSGYQIADILK